MKKIKKEIGCSAVFAEALINYLVTNNIGIRTMERNLHIRHGYLNETKKGKKDVDDLFDILIYICDTLNIPVSIVFEYVTHGCSGQEHIPLIMEIRLRRL